MVQVEITKGGCTGQDHYFALPFTGQSLSIFDAAFSKKSIPDEIPILIIDLERDILKDIIPQIIKMGYVKSKSEFIRLIKQGGVQLNGEKIDEDDINQVLYNSDVLRIGKKHFVRINK